MDLYAELVDGIGYATVISEAMITLYLLYKLIQTPLIAKGLVLRGVFIQGC